MNRTNNGYQLQGLQLPQNQAAPLPGANLSAVAQSLEQSAAGLEQMARREQEMADALATVRGRADGMTAATGRNPAEMKARAGTAYGDAFMASRRDALAAEYEVRLRTRLGEIDAVTPDDDDTGFEAAGRGVIEEVLAPIARAERDDPDPVWQELRQGLGRMGTQLVASGTTARAGRRQAQAERLELDTLQQRTATRQNDVLALTRDAVTARLAAPAPADGATAPAEPLPQEAALAAAEQAWLASLVALGPKEGFTLGGVTYEADPSRRGAVTADGLAEQVRRVRVAQLSASETVAQEAAGGAQAQAAHAQGFAARWRAREGMPDGATDAELEAIEVDLKQRAAMRLGEERTREAATESELRELFTFVSAGGRLTPDQEAEGDRLLGLLEDEGLAQQWDNAKTMSRTGARDVADGYLRSINGNAAPRMPVSWGSTGRRGGFRFNSGGGRRRRSGGGDDDGGAVLDRSTSGGAFMAFANGGSAASSNPLQWAFRQGLSVPVLNLQDLVSPTREAGQRAGEQLLARRSFSAQLSDQAGVPGRIFTNAEVDWFKDRLERDPQQAVVAASIIRNALGNDAPRALAELGLSRGAGMAAGLVANGTSPAFVQSMMRGSGTRAEVPRPLRTQTVNIATDLRNRWSHAPHLAGQMAEVQEATLAVMRDRVEQGEPPGDPAGIMQSILGGTRRGGVDYGGFTSINGAPTLVPGWLRRDRMDDLWHFAVSGLEYSRAQGDPQATYPDGRVPTARQLRGMQLLPIGDNQYVVATGRMTNGRPQVLMGGGTGEPYVLDADMMRAALVRHHPDWMNGR